MGQSAYLSHWAYPIIPRNCNYTPFVIIKGDKTEPCVPCDPKNKKVRGKWCKPKTADLCDGGDRCEPCDSRDLNLAGNGWMCINHVKNDCNPRWGKCYYRQKVCI